MALYPNFKRGEFVTGLGGVQTHFVSSGKRLLVVDTTLAPLEKYVGGLGMPGRTAYFGLLEIAKPQLGETLVVSAAAGAVGSVVGQIGKIYGCRVVGIAGGEEKCRHVVENLGFDACIDYNAVVRSHVGARVTTGAQDIPSLVVREVVCSVRVPHEL